MWCLEGRDQEDHSYSRSAQAKTEQALSQSKRWVWYRTPVTHYTGGIRRRIMAPGKNHETPSEKQLKKKGQGCGSSGRQPA
jgi:hypothetical protein